MHICIQWRIVGNESIQRLQTFFINVRFFLLFTFYSFFERFCIYALGSIGSSETMNDFVGFKLILHLRIYNCYV